MTNIKTLLAAAAIAVGFGAGAANAAPWDRQGDHQGPAARHEEMRQDARRDTRRDFRRPIVVRERVYDTLRFRHYRGLGNPYFVGGHYVVRVVNPFGRTIFVEVDPYTGAFIGEFRA